MGLRSLSACGAIAVIAVAGCGGSSHHTAASTSATSTRTTIGGPGSTPPGPPPAGPPGAYGLAKRTLHAGELRGFTPAQPEAVVDPRAWVAVDQVNPAQRTAVAARLRRLGFVAGVREDLVPLAGGSSAGLSVVEQFHSPSAARAELGAVLPSLLPGTTIKVPGVPGARGFASSGTSGSGDDIVFADGPYFYLVGVGWQASSTSKPTSAILIAATQHLYHRVHH